MLQIPTATDDIAPNQWGAGITGVALKQANGWTVGMLANHVWSIGKSDQYGDSSNTFLQPFLSYTTTKATSFGINTESTYNWETEEWSVPINLTVAQIIKVSGKPVQLTGGVRYWADSPEGGARGLGRAPRRHLPLSEKGLTARRRPPLPPARDLAYGRAHDAPLPERPPDRPRSRSPTMRAA